MDDDGVGWMFQGWPAGIPDTLELEVCDSRAIRSTFDVLRE